MANVLSSSFVNEKLAGFVAAQEYTKFYEALYLNGSAISALYIPGPTGQGLFGGLSHNQVADNVDGFPGNRYDVSEAIANALLVLIKDTKDENGQFRMPTDIEFLAAEIVVFETRGEDLGLSSAAYPGHDLINFLGLEVEGATGGQGLFYTAVDLAEALVATSSPFPILNGDIVSEAELFAQGGEALTNGFGQIAYYDADGNLLPKATGVFEYKDVLYSTNDLVADGNGFLKSGGTPLGVTKSLVFKILSDMGAGQLDLSELNASVSDVSAYGSK